MKVFVSQPESEPGVQEGAERAGALSVIQEILGLEHEVVVSSRENIDRYREQLMDADVCIAEVSKQSLSVGIDLGWSHMLHSTIICIAKHGTPIPAHIQGMAKAVLEYRDEEDLKIQLFSWMQNYSWSYD